MPVDRFKVIKYWNSDLIERWRDVAYHRKELNRNFKDPDFVARHLELLELYRLEVIKTAGKLKELKKNGN